MEQLNAERMCEMSREIIKIELNKDNVLILKTDMFLKQDALNAIQKNIIKGLEEGVAIIPNGFSYEILKHNQIKDEIIASEKAWQK